MDIENVEDAANGTKNHFDDFWLDPEEIEKQIFYEFLLMQTFVQIQASPALLSDYGYKNNSMIVSEHGVDFFNLYSKGRDVRFQEYLPKYTTLAATPCFKEARTPSTDEDFMAIHEFCGVVFNYVEKGYISSLDAERNLTFAQKCLQIMTIHTAYLLNKKG